MNRTNSENIIPFRQKHEDTLFGNSEVLGSHRLLHESHSKKLESNSKKLESHSKILESHSKILESHSKTLAEHTLKLNEHSIKLNVVDSKIDNLSIQFEDHRHDMKAVLEFTDWIRDRYESKDELEHKVQSLDARVSALEVTVSKN